MTRNSNSIGRLIARELRHGNKLKQDVPATEGTQSMTELLPCPFCGIPARRIKNHGSQEYWGHCRHCFADGPMQPSEAEAIAAWNTRAPVKEPNP